MTKITIDSATGGKLKVLAGPVILCDEAGNSLGYFNPCIHSLKDLSPFSDEEIEQRRRQYRTGRQLNEILADLEKQA